MISNVTRLAFVQPVAFLLLVNVVLADSVRYDRDVKPILKARCYACHGALKQEGGLRLDTGRFIRQGGDSDSAVNSKLPDSSLIIERVSATDDSERMPPEGEALSPKQIKLLSDWIRQGANSPEGEQAESDPNEHWAFLPLVRPTVPNEEQHPIDAFLIHKMAQEGVSPRPIASKHVLLRRVYLDLIGLPPTPEELRAFLANKSDDAYQQVVERLLNDPRYGERWGRHWMDIWRYSDWYGRRHVPDVWNSAPQVWRWRDWIVRSLNEDKGYDQMIREMLAADEISPEDPGTAVATGYLIRNWYALNPNDWMRNTVEHTGKAFLGLTINCAHCHDHKYDPITQEDYFRFRAFFEPMYVRQDRMAGEADPGPFQDYNYSTLRKIQRLGIVRVFDKTPEAPTWFYSGGDERNRNKDRGPILPGVPEFISQGMPEVKPVELPPRASYPGLSPAIQETVLADAHNAISAAEKELTQVRQSDSKIPQNALDQLAAAKHEYQSALEEAKKTGKLTALSGSQSLLFDATQGRRVLQNRFLDLKVFPEGSTIEFQLFLVTDAHFNFQLAKHLDQGLTAGYVGFENGRIISYQPESFTEFEVGRYDFKGNQNRFHVHLTLDPKQDRCRLTVRSTADDTILVDTANVALNGWNPIGDPTKGISFDARTGSIAAVDELILKVPSSDASNSETETVAHFNFEPPSYPLDRDVIGLGGWEVSSFGSAPATSVLANSINDPMVAAIGEKVKIALRAVQFQELAIRASEAKLAAARDDLTSINARMAADKAKYGETPDLDATALARKASQEEFAAKLHNLEAQVLAQEHALALAETKPASDASRAKEITSANKQLADFTASLEKTRSAPVKADSVKYSAFSPVYPSTSTGRRSALAAWMTNRENPLTARVAVNHIWTRHFHAPLVESVSDFGRNGAKPEHPELIDWLAVEFLESGWSMKHLHRLVVTSDAYRRVSSTGSIKNPSKMRDVDNKFLWRRNAGRMEAEIVRDSLLACGGLLDSTMGGQSLENKLALTTYRRSLYYEVFPEDGGSSELSRLFDAPSPIDCYRRTRSIVPQQALALTNSNLVHLVSKKVVDNWQKRFPDADDEQFIHDVFERILSRSPTDEERRLCQDAINDQVKIIATSGSSNSQTTARESLVRALFNHNDFVTIR